MEIFFYTISETFNNTFLGTLFAGLFLGLIGISWYKKQKEIDLDFHFKKDFEIKRNDFLREIYLFKVEADDLLKSFMSSDENIILMVENIGNEELIEYYTKQFSSYQKKIFESYSKLSTEKFDELESPLANLRLVLLGMRFAHTYDYEELLKYKEMLDENYIQIKNFIENFNKNN